MRAGQAYRPAEHLRRRALSYYVVRVKHDDCGAKSKCSRRHQPWTVNVQTSILRSFTIAAIARDCGNN